MEVDHATHADLIDSTEPASPLPVHERIPALDVLRGVAVAGILLANVQVFFGLTFIPPDRLAASCRARRFARSRHCRLHRCVSPDGRRVPRGDRGANDP